MAIKAQKLLDAALQQGLISNELLTDLTQQSRRERQPLLDVVCFRQRLTLSALYHSYAQSRQLPYITPTTVDDASMRRLPASLLARQSIAVVPHNDSLHLLVTDPDDHFSIDTVRRLTGAGLALAMAEPDTIAMLVQTWQRRHASSIVISSTVPDNFPDNDPVALLDNTLRQAYMARASDIHLQPEENAYVLRYRIDGRLQEAPRRLSQSNGSALLSRLKVLAGLDIAETRAAQDGSLGYRINGMVPMDIRVATLPTRHGERATLRLLGDNSDTLTLSRLGMNEHLLQRFRATISRPHGMILVTGPTGSGKSSTLYAALNELLTPEINILTVEDPIERLIPGASQVQVSSKLDFAGTLRSFLRHDPDVIMLGEIRDPETADVALKSAMTGHLVFSTLHTNSAAGAVSRLVDMGMPRFLIASTLIGVLAQRLVRQLCPHCRQQRLANAREIELLQMPATTVLFQPTGCPNCNGSGYRGRTGLFEVLWLSEHSAQLINAGADESTLLAATPDFYSLWHDGRQKVLSGHTTLDEILRVSAERKP